MDGIFTNKRDAEPAPHVAGVSVVPPEDTAVDEPFRAGLLSHETSAAVGSAFYTLTQAVRKQNSQTLEDLVREILHPRLASWLDNLPGLIEHIYGPKSSGSLASASHSIAIAEAARRLNFGTVGDKS